MGDRVMAALVALAVVLLGTWVPEPQWDHDAPCGHPTLGPLYESWCTTDGPLAEDTREVGDAQPAVEQSVWDRLAWCESRGDWQINTGNGYSGGLQWAQATWWAMRDADDPFAAWLALRDEEIAAAERLRDYEQGARQGRVRPVAGVRPALGAGPMSAPLVFSVWCHSGPRISALSADGACFVTPRQLTVLLSLVDDDRTTRRIADDWPGLTVDSAYSIVQALYRKKLVRPVGFDHDGREWGATSLGRAFVDEMPDAWADPTEVAS